MTFALPASAARFSGPPWPYGAKAHPSIVRSLVVSRKSGVILGSFHRQTPLLILMSSSLAERGALSISFGEAAALNIRIWLAVSTAMMSRPSAALTRSRVQRAISQAVPDGGTSR